MPSARAGALSGLAAQCAVGIVATLVGVCAGWVSRAVWHIGVGDLPTLAVPWGLLVALAGSVSLVALAVPIRKGAPLVAAICWFAGIIVLVARGDTIVAGDGRGISFLVIVSAAVIVTATLTGARP